MLSVRSQSRTPTWPAYFRPQSLSVASGVKAATNASESPAFVASMKARIACGVSAGSMIFPFWIRREGTTRPPAVRSLRYGQQVGEADPGQELAADLVGDLRDLRGAVVRGVDVDAVRALAFG